VVPDDRDDDRTYEQNLARRLHVTRLPGSRWLEPTGRPRYSSPPPPDRFDVEAGLLAGPLATAPAVGAWARAGSGVAVMSHTRERLRRFLIRAMSRTHGAVYRASGGRLLGRVVGMPVLLLTTTGRRSGKPRTAALTYFRDGADFVVIGSFGGSDLPPAWWLNLQHDPHASVVIGGTTSRVTARAATAEEHDRLWPLATTTHPGYARYQERTARLIPIVMLIRGR
jgi:deazaflavin-dependent oxidoreductase (nitroreductase family)